MPAGSSSFVDQPADLRRAARVQEHVALADGRLLGQQPGLEQRLPHRLGERALVAGEAAAQVREVGVVAAPLAHAVEPLEDPAGDAAGGIGVLVRAGSILVSWLQEREHGVLVLLDRARVLRATLEARDRLGDAQRVVRSDRVLELGLLEQPRGDGDGAGPQPVDAAWSSNASGASSSRSAGSERPGSASSRKPPRSPACSSMSSGPVGCGRPARSTSVAMTAAVSSQARSPPVSGSARNAARSGVVA